MSNSFSGLASKTRRVLLGSLALAVLPRVSNASANAQELLAQFDALRNPSRPFAFTTTLLEYRDGRQKETLTLRAYASPSVASGQFRSIVWFQAPAQDIGKLMLKDGSNLWFFDPTSKATVRISPQQRLLGQAANGDVVATNFSVDYAARIDGEETIINGERSSVSCTRLALDARTPEATYHHALLWLQRGTSVPVKAQFFVESGILLKTAFYRRLRPVLGADRPTEIVLIDGLDPKWITVMKFDGYAWRDVPETWLQRDYLPRFKPE